MDRQYNDQNKNDRRTDNTMTKIKMTGQTIQWQNKNDRRTDNTMTKIKMTEGQAIQWQKWQKDRQYNDQNKNDRRTDNTMTKIKMTEGQTIQWQYTNDRQYNDKIKMTERQTIQWPK
jgi:hypothetical protein